MEMPFYVPTSFGEIAVGASLERDQESQGHPVLFMAGGEHPRGRDRVRLQIARDLASKGRPAFRIDYPGAGLSPSEGVDGEDLLQLLLEVVAWIRDICSAERIAVGGTCRGAAHAVALAARDSSINSVVAVDCPIMTRLRKTRRRVAGRLRAGIAAIDPIGTRATPLLVGGGRNETQDLTWSPPLMEALEAASATANICFVYGGNDVFYGHLQRLIAEGPLPAEVTRRWTVEVRPDAQLYGFSEPADMKWLREVVVAFLLSTEQIRA